MRLVLTIRSGPEAGREIAIAPGAPVRFGRKEPADFVFAQDHGLSRLHFAIKCDAEIARLLDLNSSNGTWVNGQQVKGAVLKDGDEISAGGMKFAVRFEREPVYVAPPPVSTPAPPPFLHPAELSSPLPLTPIAVAPPVPDPALAPAPPAPVPTAPPPPEPTPEERLLHVLREDFQPLYAILDGARSPQIYKILAEAKEEARKAWQAQNPGVAVPPAFQPPASGILEGGAQYESLYEGWSKAQLALFAPYLVSLPPQSKVLEKLVAGGWGKSWGVFLTCNWGFADLRHHLRHFLMVKLPDEKQVYFRFYDPRVLRVYLPTCTPEELYQFFGPIWRFAAEAEKPQDLLEFVRQGAGIRSNIWHLAAKGGPAGAPSPDATQRVDTAHQGQ
jgi:hypothetical protein